MMLIISILSSCGINNNIILKTGRNYDYDELPTEAPQEYVIAPGDRLSFRIFKNNGEDIIDGSGGGGANMNQNAGISYLVRNNGEVELPYLGNVNLTGMTIKEAENFLEKEYSKYYRDIFAVLEVTNKRIFISPGGVGEAQVITLPNNSTTLLEALALAGGISDRGNAKMVKVIRRVDNDIKVFKIDLSTIDGIQDAGLIVQANDFIYVEPMKRLASEALQEVTPVLSLITTMILVYSLISSNPFN